MRATRPRPDRWLESTGTRLRFRDEGAGDAFVLVHGWALSLEYWDELADALSASHRVLRIDRRGFGESPGPADLASDAADIVTLLDAADVERAAVVGMSQGARVALLTAIAHPDRVSHLVLDGAPPDPLSAAGYSLADLPVALYREQLAQRGAAALRRAIAASPLFELHTPDARTQRRLATLLEAYSGRDLAACVPMPRHAPDRLDAVRPPVLLLAGEHDPRRSLAGDLARALPRASRVVIAGAGHLCALEQPLAYRDALIEFVTAMPRTLTNGAGTP
jgi:pimeloyl-ACP methyl ester carboxylesterase